MFKRNQGTWAIAFGMFLWSFTMTGRGGEEGGGVLQEFKQALGSRKGAVVKAGGKEAKILNQGGRWALFHKEALQGSGEWTHKWHDGTRNSVSQAQSVKMPNSLHWINGEP